MKNQQHQIRMGSVICSYLQRGEEPMKNITIKVNWHVHVLSYIDDVLTVAVCLDGKLVHVIADSSGRILERLENL